MTGIGNLSALLEEIAKGEIVLCRRELLSISPTMEGLCRAGDIEQIIERCLPIIAQTLADYESD